jgi:tRNA (mo5U34)-methyltransferase
LNDSEILMQRARDLGPWHFDFEIAPGIRTGALTGNDHSDPDKRIAPAIDPYHMHEQFFKKYYPHGLSGKELLDVGCNGGGYCFVAGELGARSAIGFDIRQHWLNQADFIQEIKYPALKNVEFKLADAKTFIDSHNSVDITIFKGMLYHLADPIHILLKLAEATREVILIETASSNSIPEACWIPRQESKTHVMSGVDGLAWHPGGPAAVKPLLSHAGFKHFEVPFWSRDDSTGQGNFRIIAARDRSDGSGGGNTDSRKRRRRPVP